MLEQRIHPKQGGKLKAKLRYSQSLDPSQWMMEKMNSHGCYSIPGKEEMAPCSIGFAVIGSWVHTWPSSNTQTKPLDGCKQSPFYEASCSLSKTAVIEFVPLKSAIIFESDLVCSAAPHQNYRRPDGLAEMHHLTNATGCSSFTPFISSVTLCAFTPLLSTQFSIIKLNKFIFKTWDSYFKINFAKA